MIRLRRMTATAAIQPPMTIAATTVFRREALVSFTDGVAATFAVVPLPASSAAFTIAFCDFATALTVCNTVLTPPCTDFAVTFADGKARRLLHLWFFYYE